jgi:hydrogenase/urease accessory protein HupE
MNAFIKVEPQQLRLVIRVSLELLATVHFPVVGRELDRSAAGPAMERSLQGLRHDITILENGVPLVASSARGRLSLPSDRSFESYDEAFAHLGRPVASDTVIYSEQGFFDAELAYPIGSSKSRFAIQTAVASELSDYVKLAIRYLPLDEDGRAMLITSRSGTVSLNPAWYRAAGGFVVLGIAHILSGIDHLLFLVCLVIPALALRQVLAIVTAFTIAHSFTLLGSAYGLAPAGVWFAPFVETAIAASIVYMSLENIVGANLGRRWLITGLFGLVHGFGFSYALKEDLQFAGRHLLLSLFSFNVGIEIGQIAVLAVMLPALALFRRRIHRERVGVIVLSAIVADTGWHWLIERGKVLWSVEWPRLDSASLIVLARWVAGVLLAVGAIRFLTKRAGTVLSRRRSATGHPDAQARDNVRRSTYWRIPPPL